jgi:hypothetical protein
LGKVMAGVDFATVVTTCLDGRAAFAAIAWRAL